MIDLNENTYCLGIWSLAGDEQDWLCAVTRDGDGPFIMRYRFRYYRDDKSFDSADDKHWWIATLPGDAFRGRIIDTVDGIVKLMILKGYSLEEPWRRIIRGDAKATVEALKTAPFIDIKAMDPN